MAIALAFSFTSCDDEDEAVTTPTSTNKTLTIDINGLEDLGSDFAYEGWIIVDGAPITTGVFTIDAEATTFVLTIEPSPDTDPAPAPTHVLAGDFTNENAVITAGHGAALGNDFSSATGGYILATPTDGGAMTDERSGVWFLDPAAGPGAALDLPTLPEGWAYEGWAVIDGTPVTTGTFTSVSGSDDAAPYSGAQAGPPYPGEDFLTSAPAGLNFPTDLASGTIVISIEPVPDNSAAPFAYKPLVGQVPANAEDHTLYDMNNNSAPFATGTVVR